jgi:hypothetical protein
MRFPHRTLSGPNEDLICNFVPTPLASESRAGQRVLRMLFGL